MTPALLTAALAFLLSVALTPVVRRLAILAGITDAPGPRRIHLRAIPRSGGLAVGTAVALACGAVAGLPPHMGALAAAGAALLLVVGFADDVLSLSPKLKLLAQVVAAILAVVSGVRLELVAPAGAAGFPALADAALTVAWIVFITNAVNLTDGLDGLASGIGVIAFSMLSAAALRGGDAASALVPLAFTGALLGFLVYNFNPASIFLGDTGSLLIGYAMAVLPLMGNGGHALPALAAFLLVAVPVTDTLLAIARRFLSRCIAAWAEGRFWFGLIDGLRNTLSPDRRHVHHRLLDLGLTQRRAVFMLYLAGGTTGALGYLVSFSPGWPVDLFAVGFAVAVIAVVESLGFDELQPVRSGLILPLLRRLASHRWLLKGADALVVMGMYAAALWVNGRLGTFTLETAIALVLMVVIQLTAFAALGVYRTAWGMAGVSGVGLLLRACTVGTVTGYVVLRLFALPVGGGAAVVYFSLVLSAVTVIRLSYVLLLHAAQRTLPAEPTLICGTAAGARHALAHLRQAGVGNLKPIGLIALRSRLQGRQVDQLPVLGTLELLPAIVREHRAAHVVIADSSLRGDRAAWVRAVCRQLGVRVHRYMEKFVSYDDTLDGHAGSIDLGAASDIIEELFEGVGIAGIAATGSASDGPGVAMPRVLATPNGTHAESQRRSDEWN